MPSFIATLYHPGGEILDFHHGTVASSSYFNIRIRAANIEEAKLKIKKIYPGHQIVGEPILEKE